jgi:hypothetical protein
MKNWSTMSPVDIQIKTGGNGIRFYPSEDWCMKHVGSFAITIVDEETLDEAFEELQCILLDRIEKRQEEMENLMRKIK